MAKSVTHTVLIPTEGKKIVLMISNGHTVAEISTKLGIKTRTIERQIETMRGKFECTSAAHLVATFIRKEIIK